MLVLNIKLITAVFALAVSHAAFANKLIECTGCTAQQFSFAAMNARDGVHIVYDLKARISRKFVVNGVDCDNRATSPSPDQKVVVRTTNCWSGGVTITEMPVDTAVLSILSDMADFDTQHPGYLQSAYAKDFELDLDNPPTGFSDPPVGGSQTGHHDAVGVAVDRSFSNPLQSARRFRNFEDAIENWLEGPDAPEALRALRSLASRITSVAIQVPAVVGDAGLGLSWNPSEIRMKVTAKDGFGNQIRMTLDPKTGVLTINKIEDRDGNPFPSRDDNAFGLNFPNQDEARVYAGLLENAGVQVTHSGVIPGNGGRGRYVEVRCSTGDGIQACSVWID